MFNYYVMNIDFAEPLLTKRPNAAKYDGDTLVLSIDPPEDFQGTVVNIADEGFNPTGEPDIEGLSIKQLNARVNLLRSNAPGGKLVILSKAQGRWLYENNPLFMPTVTEE
jgi:hypothetical protein